MSKKILIAIAMLIVLAGVIWLTVFLFNKTSAGQGAIVPAPPVSSEDSTEPVVPVTPEPEHDKVQDDNNTESDRVIGDSFNDKVNVSISGEDYYDKDSLNIEDLYNDDTAVVMDGYSFSNGFVVTSNGVFAVDSNKSIDGVEVYMYDMSNKYEVRVYELDALNVDYDSLRSEYLQQWNLQFIADKLTAEIPVDVEYDAINGIEETPYIGGEGYNFSRGQFIYNLVSYCTKECAFGQADYVCVVSPYGECIGTAFIKCDNDRVIRVQVTGPNHKECWGAIVEVTNNNIQLIK